MEKHNCSICKQPMELIKTIIVINRKNNKRQKVRRFKCDICNHKEATFPYINFYYISSERSALNEVKKMYKEQELNNL